MHNNNKYSICGCSVSEGTCGRKCVYASACEGAHVRVRGGARVCVCARLWIRGARTYLRACHCMHTLVCTRVRVRVRVRMRMRVSV